MLSITDDKRKSFKRLNLTNITFQIYIKASKLSIKKLKIYIEIFIKIT